MLHIAGAPRCFDLTAGGPSRGISCAQTESVRSAALIAMLDSTGSEIPTARHRRMSERPNEAVLQSLETDHRPRLESEFFYLWN
jgi:hypothetical protein